jgi:hypothetical protein
MRRYSILVAALALGGCGGDTTSLDPVAEAATKTAAVASARFQLAMSVPDPDTGGLLRFRGPGVIADHGHLMGMKMRLAATKDTPAFTMEAVMTDGATYLRSPAFRPAMAPGKEWLKARDTDPVGNIGQNDPSQMIDYLRVAGSVEEIGSEPIRGATTTKYRARIELDKVMQKLPEDRRKRIEPAIEQMHKLGIHEIPMTVWVDDQDLVRRATMDWTIKNPDNAAEAFHMTMTLDLFDFGTRAPVVVPAAAKTMAYADFIKQAGGG